MDDGHMASSSSAAPVKQETSETGRASPAHQPQQCISVAPTIVTPQDAIEESQLRPAEFSVLSPSARTSHTRVDLSLNPEVGSRRVQPEEGSEVVQTADDAIAQEETPAAEAEADEVEPAVPHVPQVSLTFLLVSGRRRTMSFDHEATVGRVKELVWNAWPNDWQDERPPGPSYLRILYLGKILQDDDTLSRLSHCRQYGGDRTIVNIPSHHCASLDTGVCPTRRG
ncbi:unnamed protein product [Somion occarium]|uniref:Ubiquitin-like domain-containing protein n=1 Tax=Somion occarium TaxID=3059160 RepID=A0ABP1DNF4_9APHY